MQIKIYHCQHSNPWSRKLKTTKMRNQFTKGKSWNTIAERFKSRRIMEQRSLNLFSPAMPKGTVIFTQKLLLTVLLVMVTVIFDVYCVLNTTVWPPVKWFQQAHRSSFSLVHCNPQHFWKIQAHAHFWICYVWVVTKWICTYHMLRPSILCCI